MKLCQGTSSLKVSVCIDCMNFCNCSISMLLMMLVASFFRLVFLAVAYRWFSNDCRSVDTK